MLLIKLNYYFYLFPVYLRLCVPVFLVHVHFPTLTFNLLLRCFDMTQHARHVDAVPVHVLEKDICVSSGQRAGLIRIYIYKKNSIQKMELQTLT